MNTEISLIISQLKDSFQGDPWFGKNITSLLNEVNMEKVFEKNGNEHSILELLWHMINWREFTTDRLRTQKEDVKKFKENDWRELDHSDHTLWAKGIERLKETQNELLHELKQRDDSILPMQVQDRDYDFRCLLHGIVQHDIYHVGQIAYANKYSGK